MLSHSLVLVSMLAGCLVGPEDDAPVDRSEERAPASDAARPEAPATPVAAAEPGAMVWRESPPERPVDDESPARFRLAAPAGPEPAPTPAETTRFSSAADPRGLDTLVAPGAQELVSTFTAANEYHDRFGYSLAVGDFNNDNLDDLAIGAPFEDYGAESTGLVFLFKGTSSGLTPWALISQIGSNEAFDRFGWALTTGDFNGDGIDDLAASALNEGPGGDPNAGTVFIYTGGTGGLTDWVYYHQESPGPGTNEDRDLFGYALSSGDYNGDGWDDLAVGAPGEARNGERQGVVYVLGGGTMGMSFMGEVNQGALSVGHIDERFGSALASGDFFGTPADELVVGAYNDLIDDWRAGSIFVYQGSVSGPTPWGRLDEWTLEENDDDFGRALAVGDFDGDNRDDLAVGAPGENRDTGIVFLYRGTGTTLSPWDTLARVGAQPGDRFGAALAAGRIDSDSKHDLIVGSPRAYPSGSFERAGVANAYFGHATSMVAYLTEMKQSAFTGGTNLTNENFGLTAAIGRFRNTTYGDVAIAAPDDGLSGLIRVGSVYVYKGTGVSPSFTFSTSQRLVQN
ncbi:hypothetical protein [Polyangium sp. 15x6]|uniref:hypothetical protein n=1 Tax=Polyangium sp. 15x6 TaxID=3042687 RepID=UPI00249BDA16|nr:hypothetical protein [Polyangium sp. 15x6]